MAAGISCLRSNTGEGDSDAMGCAVKNRMLTSLFLSKRWRRHRRLGGLLCTLLAAVPGFAAERPVPVPQGFGDAMGWYERSARAGDPRAQYYMGVILWRGLRGKTNHKSASDWFEKSAGKGYGPAQFSLGLAFERGLGRSRDLARAANWYALAARQGVAEAAFNLGILYERGDGVEHKPAQAAILYRQAAEAGLARAQYNLGLLLGEGIGVSKDLVQAWVWLARARDGGYAAAGEALAAVEKDMSGTQRTQAEKAFADRPRSR